MGNTDTVVFCEKLITRQLFFPLPKLPFRVLKRRSCQPSSQMAACSILVKKIFSSWFLRNTRSWNTAWHWTTSCQALDYFWLA